MRKRHLKTRLTLWLLERACYVLHRSRWWNPFWHFTLIGACPLLWAFHRWPSLKVAYEKEPWR